MLKSIIIIFFRIITLKVRIKFSIPKNIDIIIFDRTSYDVIFPIIKKYKKKIVIDGRLSNTKEIYINFTFFNELKKHGLKNLSLAYYSSLIKAIKPKLVMTIIDNSWMFGKLTKIFFNKINFLAIQQHARYEISFNENKYKKKLVDYNPNNFFFYDNLLTIGQFDIDYFKRFKIFINKAEVIGSIGLYNYFTNLNLKKKQKNYHKYDLCIISDSIISGAGKRHGIKNLENDYSRYLKYMINIIKSNNLSFVFCIKRIEKKTLSIEIDYLNKFLSEEDVNFLLKNSSYRSFKSKSINYDYMTNSNVTVAVYSTMLRENIALGRKSLSVNFFNGNITNFPVNEICHIKKSSEKQLEHRLISLLRMSKKNYIKKLKNKNKYLIDNNILDTKKKILKKIDSLLK